MTAATLTLDLTECRTRTRRTMVASVVLHALLFLWITTFHSAAIETPPITEIQMLSAGDLATIDAGPVEAAPRVAPQPGLAPRKVEKDVRFERSANRADITLDPQAPSAIADQLSARLSQLTQEERPAVPGTVVAPPSTVFGSGPVTAKGSGSGPAVALTRGGALGGAGALPLNRGGFGGGSAAAGPATLPAVKTGAAAPAQVGDATARRTIAGASVAGPIADRPVLQTVVPEYPEWAKKEAVEGSVTLYFVVRSDGTVKENVVIQKTAGFGDFDENARLALRGWLFEPLRGGRTGEQWGTITFHFRLRDAG